MPGSGRRYQFIGKTPTIFTILAGLFAANIFVSLALVFLGKYFLLRGMPNSHPCPELAGWGIQYGVPASVCWYATRSDTISLILGALLAVIIFILRKSMHRVR
jgi:hypothetical protein